MSVDAAQHESAFAAAVADGRVGDRLWLYAKHHCILACSYCLTESYPGIADRRALTPGSMLRAVEEAVALGFGSVGITGGEVFMLPSFAGTLVEIARILPTVALSNRTLFADRVLDELEPLAAPDAAIQLSLDSDAPRRTTPSAATGASPMSLLRSRVSANVAFASGSRRPS